MSWFDLSIALVGSFVAGIINTLAGNGSSITLVILTEVMGLPGNVANASNRIGILTQNAAGTYAYYRNGKVDIWNNRFIIGFTILGSIIGIWVASIISSAQFTAVFKYLLLLMLVVTLVKPSRWLRTQSEPNKLPWYISVSGFLVLGFYGGFIQMGMGIFFLAVTVLLAGYNLNDANVLKLVTGFLFTLLAVIIFQAKGLIDWRAGGIMAIGQTLGGYLTAHYASRFPKANVWAHRTLVAVVVCSIIWIFGKDWFLSA